MILEEIEKCELVCANCHTNRTQLRIQNSKLNKSKHPSKNREFIQTIKRNPCFDCGIQYNYWTMQFDHVRGKKEFK